MSSTSIKNPNVSRLVFSSMNPHSAQYSAKKVLLNQNIDSFQVQKEELKSQETKTRVSGDVLVPVSHFSNQDLIKTSKESITKISNPKLIETSSDIEDAQDSSSDSVSSDESASKNCVQNPNHREGKWSQEEHELFVEGLRLYGKKWTRISELVKTRANDAIRSHAQKFFKKIDKQHEKNCADTEIYQLVQKARSMISKRKLVKLLGRKRGRPRKLDWSQMPPQTDTNQNQILDNDSVEIQYNR